MKNPNLLGLFSLIELATNVLSHNSLGLGIAVHAMLQVFSLIILH
ncbi:hypothetical protein RchiOBHm_Chr6g0255581 [Rosa chinensis]|uniref:Uncharacterized protein n=1 Tax=Rosa chinensis TaxID=74649 RepID=A0A2P6PLW5_ROSCH|nr:hypothetical protein RchiOBHm_Chr6g0255581 [Rosa chinensis]